MTTETQTKVTDRQREILRHSLGWPKDYRNHFVTGPGSDDFGDCERLVELGLMERHSRSWVPENIYTVTDAGREVAA